jgi:hypothetical protein
MKEILNNSNIKYLDLSGFILIFNFKKERLITDEDLGILIELFII